jgi:hypothetical protein
MTTFPKCDPLSRYAKASFAASKSKMRSITGLTPAMASCGFLPSLQLPGQSPGAEKRSVRQAGGSRCLSFRVRMAGQRKSTTISRAATCGYGRRAASAFRPAS